MTFDHLSATPAQCTGDLRLAESTLPFADCRAKHSDNQFSKQPVWNGHFEQSIRRLTAAVKELQQHADATDSETTRVLLMEAQEELHKFSSKCSEVKTWRDRVSASYDVLHTEFWEEEATKAAEEDIDLLDGIPLQGLLGACFDKQNKKGSRPSSGALSSVSTMASLGGQVTPMSRASCDTLAFESEGELHFDTQPHLHCPTLLDIRQMELGTPRPTLAPLPSFIPCPSELSSPRPTLPCRESFGSLVRSASQKSDVGIMDCHGIDWGSSNPRKPNVDESSDVTESDHKFPTFFAKYDYSAKPAKVSNTASRRAPAKVATRVPSKVAASLVSLRSIIDEEEQLHDDDTWELEFLRRSHCG